MDNNYLCEHCNKLYKSPQSLWNHKNRFHKDIITNNNIENEEHKIKKEREYKCKNCDKIFQNRHNKCYHQKHCNDKTVDTNKTSIINNTTTTNSNNNNSYNNNTIIINNFGNDNLEYITENFKDRLFDNLLSPQNHINPVPRLLENIKFNPNHKENHNVKIKSDRSKIGFYYDQNKWKAINKDDLLDKLTNYTLDIFKQYFEERKDNVGEEMKKQFNHFTLITKLKSQLRKEIKSKIENIAYIFTLNNDDNELDI